jgi:Family of unknown function (DUF6650)
MPQSLDWKSLRSRVTGFSTPFFGVSWQPPADQRALCRELVVYLEDRRVLYVDHEAEVPQHCIESVLQIRHFLTNFIPRMASDSQLEMSTRHMRSACRAFLDTVGSREEVARHGFSGGHWASWVFLPALGTLRARIGTQLAIVCAAYGVEVEAELERILPPPIEVQ